MFAGRTTPDGIIALVLDEVNRLGGLRKAFPHNGLVQLYSGPNCLYKPFLVGSTAKNSDRAEKQIKEKDWDAKRVDDTPIGDFLFVDNNLYDWLYQVHAALPKDEIDERVDTEAKQVMAFVSALFIRAAHGHVKTAVCGADRERVFYETEIPGLCDRNAFPPEAQLLVKELLDNKDIESINGVPIAVFRNIQKKSGNEAVYERICLTELRERWLYAQNTGNADDYADYLDRLELYRVDRFEHHYKHMPVASRPKTYQDLALPEADRIAAREDSLRRFKAAKALTVPTATPAPAAPVLRVAGARRVPLP